jgi:hypothetical protein
VSSDNPYYIKLNIGLEEFFNNEHFSHLTNTNIKHFENDTMINNSIFIFNSIPLAFIIAAFKLQNVLLTAGSKNHRGILSPVHHRLSLFNTCLEGYKLNTIIESYHNYNKLAILPVFNHTVLDHIDTLQRTSIFFGLLEEFFRMKLNTTNLNHNFNLKKNNVDDLLKFSEFIEFCKSRKDEIAEKIRKQNKSTI